MGSNIPTDVEFEHFIEAVTHRHSVELDSLIHPLLERFSQGEQLSIADFLPFRRATAVAYNAAADKVEALPAFAWIRNERGIGEAFSSMKRSQKRRAKWSPSNTDVFEGRLKRLLRVSTREEILETLSPRRMAALGSAEYLDRHIEDQQLLPQREFALSNFLRNYADTIAYEAYRPIASAFRHYFYRNRPSEVRQLKVALQKLEASSATLLREVETLIKQRHSDGLESPPVFKAAQKHSARLVERAREELEMDDAQMDLAQRHDAFSRERFLLFDLHFGLRPFGWHAGPAALSEFMTVDGIRNRLDPRTVERLIARWGKSVNRQIRRHDRLEVSV